MNYEETKLRLRLDVGMHRGSVQCVDAQLTHARMYTKHTHTHAHSICSDPIPQHLTALIPIETAGRKLDDDSWDRKTPNLEPMEDAFIVNDVRV